MWISRVVFEWLKTLNTINLCWHQSAPCSLHRLLVGPSYFNISDSLKCIVSHAFEEYKQKVFTHLLFLSSDFKHSDMSEL